MLCCNFVIGTSNSKTALENISLLVLLMIPKFASVVAANFCELRNRSTSKRLEREIYVAREASATPVRNYALP